MGNSLNVEDQRELAAKTEFSVAELERLYRRFQRLDKDGSGTISVDEFMGIPQLAMNPLARRIVSVLDERHGDASEIGFQEFAQALSVFHARSSREAKLQFAFRVFDVNDDGYIDAEELYAVLKLMVGDNLSAEELLQIVQHTLTDPALCDPNRTGAISSSASNYHNHDNYNGDHETWADGLTLEQFGRLVERVNLERIFTLDFSTDGS